MGLKTKLAMTLATSAAGAAMVMGGSYAIFTAQGNVGPVHFQAGTVKIDSVVGSVTPTGRAELMNIAPGDNFTGQVSGVNDGTLNEWVKVDTNVNGTLFADNGVTGNSLGSTTLGSKTDFTSVDYAPTNNSPAFAFDNNPAYFTYSLSVMKPGTTAGSWVADTNVSLPATVGNFTSGQTSPIFELPVGDKVVVNYTGGLPLDAHNDYQGATGWMATQIDAVQHRNIDGSMQNPDLNDLQVGGTYYDGAVNQSKLQPQTDQYANSAVTYTH